MKFELTRKPGTVLSCRPRAQKTPTKDIFQRVDAYYSQKAKAYEWSLIIHFPPKLVRGVQGKVPLETTGRSMFEIEQTQDRPEEPPLLQALKDETKSISNYINDHEVSKLLEYAGLKEWYGEFVSMVGPSICKTWTKEAIYRGIDAFLEDEPGVFVSHRGKLRIKLKKLINEAALLPYLEDNFLKDDRDTCYIPFRNTVVKITKDGPYILPYSEIQGWVWEHNIIDHDFNPPSELSGDWWDFLRRTCSERGDDGPVDGSFEEDRFEALLCAIGYNIHRYKRPSRPALTILSEEYNGKKNDGGTGKGIICKSIKHMNRKFNREDGKSITKDNRFNFAELDASIDIAYLDDLDCKTFRLQELYAKVTDDITVEPKNQPKKTIPYEEAPKFLINTNDISPIGTDGSDLRRRMDIQLKHYYGHEHKPIDDFENEFWSEDWTEDDWNQFYNVQIHAVQKSLQHNVAIDRLPKYANTIIDDSIRHEISEKLSDIFEAKLKDRIEAGGEIKLTNAELSTWVDDMSVKDIKSKLVKYHQLELNDKYDIQYDVVFKLPGGKTSQRGIKLIPKPAALTSIVAPHRG